MQIQAIIKDLERRFQLIMEVEGKQEGEFLFYNDEMNTHIRATRHDHPIFFGAVREYVKAVQRAVSVSSKLHSFDHHEHDKFEKEVCERIMSDETIPEESRGYRVKEMFSFYFAPMYDALCDVAEKIESGNNVAAIIESLPLSGQTYREFVKRVHPSIIAILDSEVVNDVPSQSNRLLSAASFDPTKSKICLGEKSCDVPPNTNLYYFCEKMFSVPFGTKVASMDIAESGDWMSGGGRSVYDALRAMNDRVKTDLGLEKLFLWGKEHAWINEKLFDH
ncbi:MAG: hypothetical protein Q7S84_00430 [bacterium]|nr:hypothetical protein [bacterium]